MIALQPIPRLIVLGLVIYGFLRLVEALLEAFHSMIIPFSRRRAVRRNGRRRGRRGRITRLGPGRFLIQEEEWRPRGKPDGGCGGGRRRPPGWDLIREAKPRICYWCRSDLPLGKGIHKIQYRVVIDLEKLERKLVGTRTLWRVYWVRCPACGGLVSEGDLVNAPKGHVFGYGITAYAIARQLVT